MKNKQTDWFKEHKNEFFKEKKVKIPKRNKENFKPEKVIKTIGSLALIGIGTAVAINLLTDKNAIIKI
jgi:hypothetical protein